MSVGTDVDIGVGQSKDSNGGKGPENADVFLETTLKKADELLSANSAMSMIEKLEQKLREKKAQKEAKEKEEAERKAAAAAVAVAAAAAAAKDTEVKGGGEGLPSPRRAGIPGIMDNLESDIDDILNAVEPVVGGERCDAMRCECEDSSHLSTAHHSSPNN